MASRYTANAVVRLHIDYNEYLAQLGALWALKLELEDRISVWGQGTHVHAGYHETKGMIKMAEYLFDELVELSGMPLLIIKALKNETIKTDCPETHPLLELP